MVFWGGSVVIPAGCRGPAMVRMKTDWFAETITCEDGQSITLAGGMVEPSCQSSGLKARAASLRTGDGHEVLVCSPAREPKGKGYLAADVGSLVHVTADVRSAADAERFLEVVASYSITPATR